MSSPLRFECLERAAQRCAAVAFTLCVLPLVWVGSAALSPAHAVQVMGESTSFASLVADGKPVQASEILVAHIDNPSQAQPGLMQQAVIQQAVVQQAVVQQAVVQQPSAVVASERTRLKAGEEDNGSNLPWGALLVTALVAGLYLMRRAKPEPFADAAALKKWGLTREWARAQQRRAGGMAAPTAPAPL